MLGRPGAAGSTFRPSTTGTRGRRAGDLRGRSGIAKLGPPGESGRPFPASVTFVPIAGNRAGRRWSRIPPWVSVTREWVAIMAGKRVLVIGGNFGGLTAALELKHELGEDVDVTVVSASDRFLFNPSLIWLPFGKRNAADITFALEPTFDAHGIDFVHAEATAIDPAARTVTTASQSYGYDYLVVATGFRNKFDIVPGLGPDGYAQTITTLADAERAAWRGGSSSPTPARW